MVMDATGRWIIDIEIKLISGHLHEVLAEVDRQEMVRRMSAMLSDDRRALREGLGQILTDQANKSDMHEPVIVRLQNDDEIHWTCNIADFDVDIAEYPNPSGGDKTPKRNKPDKDLYDFRGGVKGKLKGQTVESGAFKNKAHAQVQLFYKYSVNVKGFGDLDPCIICDP